MKLTKTYWLQIAQQAVQLRLGHVAEVVKNLPNFVEYMRRREDTGRQGICKANLWCREIWHFSESGGVIPSATGIQFCASIPSIPSIPSNRNAAGWMIL